MASPTGSLEMNPPDTESYDVAIIGGGIYGACIAAVAANRGYSVILLEQGDFACRASANNLRLIHGGIRYLQTLNIKRTVESIKQRRQFFEHFAYGVKPLQCVMPLANSLLNNSLTVTLGFGFYNFLVSILDRKLASTYGRNGLFAEKTPDGQRRRFAQWSDMQLYYPERPIVEYLKYAAQHGAVIKNHHKVIEVVNGEAVEANSADPIENKYSLKTLKIATQNHQTELAKARVVIDCTGGEDRFVEQDKNDATIYCLAVNVVLNLKTEEPSRTTRIDSETYSRLLFVTPCDGYALAGTWYFQADSQTKIQLTEEQRLLIEEDLAVMLGESFSVECIASVQTGLLPLDDRKKSASDLAASLSSQSRFFEDCQRQGVFRVEGIKYTSALYDAQRMFDQIARGSSLNPAGVIDSKSIVLASQITAVDEFLTELQNAHGDIASATLSRLLGLYGANAQIICQQASGRARQAIAGLPNTLFAELDYIVEHEWGTSIEDILHRRMGLRYPDEELSDESLEEISHYLAPLLEWNDDERVKQVRHYRHTRQHMNWKRS